MTWYQQGDVLIKPTDKIPDGAVLKDDRILARGEATGHKHLACGTGVQLYTFQAEIFMEVSNSASITHAEHETLEIPAGLYYVQIVREYDHFAEEARNVRD